MQLPSARGPLSGALIQTLGSVDSPEPTWPALTRSADPLADEDLQLTLWVAYELHYRGFDGVDDCWEWDPEILRLRRELEQQLLSALRRDVVVPPAGAASVPQRLRALVDDDDGRSLARYVQRDADWAQFVEFAKHRSVYQLKEADPHTWAVPRLTGAPKAALIEIQADEYGNGDLSRMHSQLYVQLLDEIGLDSSYGAYVEVAPAITLAISNVMSMFGLRRDLRGALVGHLAAYEMTSSTPCRRYAQGLRRLGGSDRACAFYDVHVTADALHEQIAAYDLGGGLAEAEPALAEDIVFGAAACLHVDNRFAAHLFDCWENDRSTLRSTERRPLVGAA